ncbi:MAG: type II secretion system protein [Tepidisphaeraceae bacterium]|jgi:general secretion pathway protein G
MRRVKGFTLTEVLIVLVILGAVAAIVVPQFTEAGQNQREVSVQNTLQTIRGQIQLYRMQHGNKLPDLTNGWTALTRASTFGNSQQNLGPYLHVPPTDALNGLDNVTDGTGDFPAKSACGFIYDYNGGKGTGSIYATDGGERCVAGNGRFGARDFLAF